MRASEMRVPLRTRDGRTVTVSAWFFVVMLPLGMLVLVLSMLGTNVFLRPSVISRFPAIFAWASAASAAALLIRGVRRGLTQSATARTRGVRVLQFIVALPFGSCFCGAILTFASLLVLQQQVRLASGTPVEFRTRIQGTRGQRGCVTVMSFLNEPLLRESQVCADAYAIRAPKPGDFILVRETVSPLGGYVTAILPGGDPPPRTPSR